MASNQSQTTKKGGEPIGKWVQCWLNQEEYKQLIAIKTLTGVPLRDIIKQAILKHLKEN